MTVEGHFCSISVYSLFHSSFLYLPFHALQPWQNTYWTGICIACYDGAYVRAMCLPLLREAHACTSFSNKDSVLVTKYVFFHRYIYMHMYIYTSIYDHERESCSIATANCNICEIVSQLWQYRMTPVLYHKCTQTHD